MVFATIERRQRRRYSLQFEVEYRVFGRGHSIVSGSSKTINLSSHGILLTPTQNVSKGQLVELSINWQSGVPGAPATDLEILGRVVRVSAAGTAVMILRHGFYPQRARLEQARSAAGDQESAG